MKNRSDFITGIILAVFAIWYFVQAQSIRVFSGMGKSVINSQTMPKVWAVCLLLLACVLISRPFRNSFKDAVKKGEKQSFAELMKKNWEVTATFIALFVYALLLTPFGFIISTAVYIFVQTLILAPAEKRSYLGAAIIGVVAASATYYVFVFWLDVLLPVGKIFD
ncbi:MAG: tripartite tricarboxylate transporter TctB family protein [Succinivibrio sp.]|nr:tripartite tricarboxylate transporter TctB family protein [Succinivibrio sp.]